MLLDDRHHLFAARQIGGLLGLVKAPVADRPPLVHQIAQTRIRLLVDQAGQSHADFGTVVAAEHGAVVDEGHGAAEPGRTDGRTATGRAAADDHEIILPRILRSLRQPAQLAPQRRQHGRIVGRGRRLGGREQQRIAAALETGEVVQGERGGPLCHFHHAAVLPMPLGPFRAERRRRRLAVDKHLEDPRRAGRLHVGGRVRRFPRRNPIPRAHPEAVSARLRELDRRRRILDRHAQPVGQQEGRAHLIHRLLIHDPAARRREALRLDEHVVSRRRRDSERQSAPDRVSISSCRVSCQSARSGARCRPTTQAVGMPFSVTVRRRASRNSDHFRPFRPHAPAVRLETGLAGSRPTVTGHRSSLGVFTVMG